MFVYWSMFSSFIIFLVGLFFYHIHSFPLLLSVALMTCGMVSTLHHTRRYDEPGWETDGLRVMDLTFVLVLALFLFYYYYTMPFMLCVLAVGLLGIRCGIDCLNTCQEKTVCHACMHLFGLVGIVGLWCFSNHTRN